MGEFFVLTALGRDRVGIVDEIASVLGKKDCNIEESRMAVLGKEFAVILLASGPRGILETLSSGIDAIRLELGLHVEIRSTEAPGPNSAGRPYIIEAVSLDAPGIMHAVTAILREEKVNIEEISTETTSAPWTGATMFQMKGTVILPPDLNAADLREKLERLEHQRDIDIDFKPVNR